MKLFLLRHTHSKGRQMGIMDSISQKFDGLSKKGEKEAKKLVEELKKI